MRISADDSKRLAAIRWPLVLLVIYVHSYSGVVQFADGVVVQSTGAVFETFRYAISQVLSRIAVPALFLISGYFFFGSYRGAFHEYVAKIKDRFYSLLVPFLFWTILGVLIVAAVQQLDFLTSMVSGIKLRVADYSIFNYLDSIFGLTGYPVAYQFWFIRDLMLLVLLGPLISYLFLVRWYFVTTLAALWFFGVWPISAPLPESSFFFIFGGLLAREGIDLATVDPYLKSLSFLYFLLALADILTREQYISIFVHRAGVFVGVLTALSATQLLLRSDVLLDSLVKLGSASFFVFAAHEPILTALRKVAFKVVGASNVMMYVFLYLAIPLFIAVALTAGYFILQKMLPRFSQFITGGR